jgi:DNA repair exonuclease SbcCD ATPase subunit
MSTCATCIYWQSSNRTCHKSPPVPVHGFATVAGNDWCGEYATESQPLAQVVRGVSREDVAAALREAEERHHSELFAAAKDAAERQARFSRELSQSEADRAKLSKRMSAAESALDTVRADHQSALDAIKRMAQREADLTARLAYLQSPPPLEASTPEPVRVDAGRPKKTWRERLGI